MTLPVVAEPTAGANTIFWGFDCVVPVRVADSNAAMEPIEFSVRDLNDRDAATMTQLFRAWFDCIVDSLSPEALMLVREICVRAGSSPANAEVIASIDRCMIQRENSGRN